MISNTAISLDGRIATAGYDHVAIGSPTDRRYMSVLRARADAVLVGGQTFRNWPLPLVPDELSLTTLRREAFFDCEAPEIAGRQWWNVVVTRSPAPSPGDAPRFFGDARVRPLFFSGALDIPTVLADLAARGVQTLLLECGGDLLAQFLAAGVVDELFVTVCPLVLGGKGAPSLVDGGGFAFVDAPRLELANFNVVGQEIYVRYRVCRSS